MILLAVHDSTITAAYSVSLSENCAELNEKRQASMASSTDYRAFRSSMATIPNMPDTVTPRRKA